MRKAEIELTSKCNAACPACRRTKMVRAGSDFSFRDLDVDLIYLRFQELELKDFTVKLCGVLGDPLVHPKMLEVTEWFVAREAKVQISTNAALRSESYWRDLGKLSASTKRVYVHFAVDGLEDTNHLYRVNTEFTAIDRNMKAYTAVGGKGHWNFIEFDYNVHQKEEARLRAEALGLKFQVRRAAKNSVYSWKVKPESPRQKEKIAHAYEVVKKHSRAHEQTETYRKILKDEYEYRPEDVNCKLLHGGEFFLASDGGVWPCCYLWDEYVGRETAFHRQMDERLPARDWNDLKRHSFQDIFAHPFYVELEKLWVKEDPRFQKRCYLSCGAKGGLRNSFSTN